MSGASKTTMRDIPPSVPSMPSRMFDVPRLIGITAWGPISQPVVSVDFDDWKRVFGGFLASYYTAVAVQQMFAGGVRRIVTVRTMHLDGTGAPATGAKAYRVAQTGATGVTKASVLGAVVGPYAFVSGDTLVGSVGGAANRTVTLAATAAARENTPAETYALVNAQDLTVKVDRGSAQTIAFLTAEFVNIAAATAEEVAAVINAKISGARATVTSAGTKVTITSDRKGTGSYIEVTGGTANGTLNFNVAEVQGTGNVSNILSVAVSELKTLIEASWVDNGGVTCSSSGGALLIETNASGALATVQVIAASTGDDEVGLDNALHSGSDGAAANTLKLWGKYYGALGNLITYDILAASGGDASRFDLVVYLSGAPVGKRYVDLTMDSTDANYVVDVLNTKPGSSDYLFAEDMLLAGTPTQRRPANATSQALASGDDGLVGLADLDFYGSESLGTGLFSFDLLPDEGDTLVCVDDTAAAFQSQATITCRDHWSGKVVFLPDPPAGLSYTNVASHADSVTADDAARSGHPWPRTKVANPDKVVYGQVETLTIPPTPLIMARMAANSVLYQQGPFVEPCNQIYGLLDAAVGLESTDVMRPGVREYVTDHLVNPIVQGRTERGSFGIWLNDIQSGEKGGLWTSIAQQRGVAHLRRVIEAYMETRRGQGMSEESRWLDKWAIEAYLLSWCSLGVFASRSPAEAFYVNTDPAGEGINNPLEQQAQNYHVVLGLALKEPARFQDIGFTRDQRAVNSYIMKQMAS